MHTVKEFKVSGKQSLSLWISQISKIYKELVQLSSKKKKKKKVIQCLKWEKNLNRHFFQKKTYK